nr:GIGYF family protein CG11148 [Leptinotarsa decemlineata]
MTDSMNFGPDWIRNLSSEGSMGGGASGGTRHQLADYRYGREEMLALFERNSKPPASLTNFKCLYSDTSLLPLALLQTSEEERGWSSRLASQPSGPLRGRGGSLERGGRIGRGRGGYQYGRPAGYEVGWGNGEQQEWSPRKEYGNQRNMSLDNWRRSRNSEEDDGWRNISQGRGGVHEKWGRSSSWRGEGDSEERTGPPERGGRSHWGENRPPPSRKTWDNEDHLPEWATENPTDGGGTFDEKGAFHGSDDEQQGKHPSRRETGLQKSTSQQHIVTKRQPPPLSSSKSTTSLVRPEDSFKKRDDPPLEAENDPNLSSEMVTTEEGKKSVPNIPEKIDENQGAQERVKSEVPPNENKVVATNGPIGEKPRNEDSDFERLQEDFVLKLVVDEELPKPSMNSLEMGSIHPPPNLAVPQMPDKWFYQDPQGQMQGPFSNMEMAEWFKAGYFSNQLKVRRHCDERFFLLGELITICGGVNPFQTGIRFPILKNDITKMPDPDIQFQYLSQMAAYKQAQARVLAEPWSAITLQQQELATQRLIMQQQQVSPDLQYLQHSQAANPLMHMINQMQQANKLPATGLVDKPPQNIPGSLDPSIQLHMSNILSLQNRIPTAALTNNLPAGLTSHSVPLPPGTLSSGLQTVPPLNTSTLPLSGIQSNIPVSIGGSINIPRHTPHGPVDQISSGPSNDPISSLLKQLQQQSQHSQQVESLWQPNSFPSNTPPQWQPQNEIPVSMWDIPQTEKTPQIPSPTEKVQQPPPQPKRTKVEKEKEQAIKDEISARELKKKKEQEEKQAKKEAEEKRKQEQKKLEAEKKAAEDRRKKEEERIKRELEKAKKEAEEKRLRELEEKRRLKEQRKAEEDAKKKMEEQKKLEDDRLREEMKEQERRRQEEEKRLQAEERRMQAEQIRLAKAAPWSQSNLNLGMSLAEIQKAEREKRAIDAALQMQRLQEEKEYQQIQQEKSSAGIQLNWAKKRVEPRKVKSLAEIQAEEQERLAKQAAESRLQKEKEPAPVTNNSSSIWGNQNLTWASTQPNTQWSSNSGGFWDDTSNRQTANKPSTVSKSNSTNTLSTVKQQSQTQKQPTKSNKAKKEEAKANHNNNNNGPPMDEFTDWCHKTLSHISTNVDIPTFVTFLRDIESAFDVREYCKLYLGESNATHQFAGNFLEKRRSFKPKNNAHKDDMCSPAPAITPSLQHSTEFQEVKGKNKKIKKSKMLKVDARILGFNVTSAPDRLNVGDRDYGDNS